ncbi:hypothetical protein [Sphingomonas sp. GB1N7]|uniref:hypothetical protein n=1 Tax=Parasphingomonas caseinilytica TaxID=3096158 RepID=UPI002FC62C0E
MASFRNKAPFWFWILGVLILLWGMMGVAAFYMDLMTTPAQLAKMSAYDQKLLASRPSWFMWLYGASVWSGLFGAIALLLRSGTARPLFWVSLVTVVVMFGYILAKTDMIAVKGFTAAAGFPIVIVVIAAFQIWFAGHARQRDWIS